MHRFHAQKLGRLDCNLCHVAAAKGSVELKPPGHDQCKLCHAAAFENVGLEKKGGPICETCHAGVALPNHASVLIDFSHTKHMDPKARTNARTGARSDCAFCHKASAAIPSHTQCAACHSQAGIQPELSTFLRTAGCRGCHAPEQMETGDTVRAPATAAYEHIRFSHADHASAACTTCHSGMARSSSLVNASLPTMARCAGCHETVNCQKCHVAGEFNRNTKPASHTEVFRLHHADASAVADAKCFACHQNIVPSAAAKDQCAECHLVMKPVSHTARWRDDIHGKYAALDRTECATCHAADYCSRCHNQLPASHVPLPIFKNGGHANLAVMNERSCFTCHTFQNTCSACHAQQVRPGGAIRRK